MSADAQLAAATWALLGVTLGGIFISTGILIAQVRGLMSAVKAVHRRIDELEASHAEVRDVLVAQGAIDVGTSPGRRLPAPSARSRPPILLNEEDEETPG